ncbi:MAG: hypothetical protein KAT11_00225, partial [Phycisphaerae bacterium]|nr:hypothetical protein [Phycisphaerae bacterium]
YTTFGYTSRIIGSNGYYRCVGRVQKGNSFCEGLSYRQAELEQNIISQIVGFDTNLDSTRQRDLMTSILHEFTVFPEGKIKVGMKPEAEPSRSDTALSQYSDPHFRWNAQKRSFKCKNSTRAAIGTKCARKTRLRR